MYNYQCTIKEEKPIGFSEKIYTYKKSSYAATKINYIKKAAMLQSRSII
jgi:hypothetical protein